MKSEDNEIIIDAVSGGGAHENIEDLNKVLIQLEKDPKDVEAMEKAERYLHNLKGRGGIVAEQEIIDFAHNMESIISQARKGKKPLSTKQCDELLHGAYSISILFEKSTGIRQTPTPITPTEETIHSITQEEEEDIDDFDWPDMVPEFVDSCRDNIKTINSGLLRLKKDPKDRNIIEEIHRNAHNLKGSASIVNMEKIVSVSREMEDILREHYEGGKSLTSDIIDLLLGALDSITAIIDALAEGKNVEIEIGPILNKLASIKELN